MKFSDCKFCGLPSVMCSCRYPDAVYNAADIARTELFTNREISPMECMGDYDRSRAFTEAYLSWRRGSVYPE